jgi:hypothetical protein
MCQLCWDNPHLSVVWSAMFGAWWFVYTDDATKCSSVSWKQFIKYKVLLDWYKLNVFLTARNVYIRSHFITNQRTAVVMHIQYLNNKLFILIIFAYSNITINAMARNGIVRIYVGMFIRTNKSMLLMVRMVSRINSISRYRKTKFKRVRVSTWGTILTL